MARKYTNALIEQMEEGAIKAEDIVMMCLSYMSEHDVEDMCIDNEINLFPGEDDDNDEG